MAIRRIVEQVYQSKDWRGFQVHQVLAERFPAMLKAVRDLADKEGVELGVPGPVELGAQVAVALMGRGNPHLPPVPWEFLDAVRRGVEAVAAPMHRDGPAGCDEEGVLAGELAVAALCWADRRSLGMAGADWNPLFKEATSILLAYIDETVQIVLGWLGKKVIGFPSGLPSLPFAREVLHRFVGRGLRCTCWCRSAGVDADAIDPADPYAGLTANQRTKAEHCMLTAHHISLWRAEEMSLWFHVQRAVKGCVGPVLSGALPTGMLWDRILAEARRRGPSSPLWLKLVSVAQGQCTACEKWSAAFRCGSGLTGDCHGRLDMPADVLVRAERGWIVADPPDGGGPFVPQRVLRCRHCGSIYIDMRCQAPCRLCGDFQTCPHCDADPPGGTQGRCRTVYYLKPTGGGGVLGAAAAHAGLSDACRLLAGGTEWTGLAIACLRGMVTGRHQGFAALIAGGGEPTGMDGLVDDMLALAEQHGRARMPDEEQLADLIESQVIPVVRECLGRRLDRMGPRLGDAGREGDSHGQ